MGQQLYNRTQGKYSLITDYQHITQKPNFLVCVLNAQHNILCGVMYASNLTLNLIDSITLSNKITR